MLSFVDKCWTTFVSPLGLRKIMGSCCASQKQRNFAAHLSGGSRGVNSLLEKSVLLINCVTRNRILKVSSENVTNRVHVAPFGLKLSQNESYGLQEHI